MTLHLFTRDHKPAVTPRLPENLTAAADRLQAAVDDYAAVYGQHHPTAGVSQTAARQVYADLATITRHLNTLRVSGSVVAP